MQVNIIVNLDIDPNKILTINFKKEYKLKSLKILFRS